MILRNLILLLVFGWVVWCIVKNVIGAQHRSGHGR